MRRPHPALLLILAPAVAPAPGCAVFPRLEPVRPPAYEQHVEDLESPARSRLRAIEEARTERAVLARVDDFAAWVLSDSERIGLANHGLIVQAVRRNPHIRELDRVERHLFDVTDVWPADCSPASHSRIEQRIQRMQQVARACDQEKLAAILEERRGFVRGTRANLDAHGICLR